MNQRHKEMMKLFLRQEKILSLKKPLDKEHFELSVEFKIHSETEFNKKFLNKNRLNDLTNDLLKYYTEMDEINVKISGYRVTKVFLKHYIEFHDICMDDNDIAEFQKTTMKKWKNDKCLLRLISQFLLKDDFNHGQMVKDWENNVFIRNLKWTDIIDEGIFAKDLISLGLMTNEMIDEYS